MMPSMLTMRIATPPASVSDILRTVACTAVSPRNGGTLDRQFDKEQNSSRISLGISSESRFAKCWRYASHKRCLIGPLDASVEVAAKKCSQALLMQLTPAWVKVVGPHARARRHGFERLLMLRIYFNFAWQLFLRPLKRLQPEYTPATSKGKQASTAFHVRSA